MNEQEWQQSEDVREMVCALDALYGPDAPELDQRLRRYYLACCRRIWRLLPEEGSRRGVEVAERQLRGEATEADLDEANYYAEGAAFHFDYQTEPGRLREQEAAVAAIAADEMHQLIGRSLSELGWNARELLKRAAYFADYAMMSHRLLPKRLLDRRSAPFVSAALLREHFGNPFAEHGVADVSTNRTAARDDGMRWDPGAA